MMVPQIKNGILNINKPQGITSHDVVDFIRKIFPNVKVGHTGTLDPIATGVLPIVIGEATKLSNMLTGENKVYRVTMLLGVETDTYDITGNIVFASVVNKDEIYIQERIKRFIGKQKQTPPKYSAIRVEGKHSYELAREGKEVNLEAREIEIFDIQDIQINLELKEVSFTVFCTKGTYIRSLVNDIGKNIGCGATMVALERIQTGNFKIEDSIPLYDYLKLEYFDMVEKIISIEEYYKEAKKVTLNETEYEQFLNGVKIRLIGQNQIVRIYMNGVYHGLGRIEDNILKRFIIE